MDEDVIFRFTKAIFDQRSDLREGSTLAGFLEEALAYRYRCVRIIHGKGRGTLRRIVHSVLEKHDSVLGFELADPFAGGWGATLVELRIP